MKKHFVFLIITLLMISSLKAQVKIGDNPQNLDPASVLELESNNRVLVITRVSNAQMSTISPLPGALVYNTDADCIHYFNGTEWINICEALDNSFTTSTQAVFNTLPDSRDSTVVVTRTDTPDGINYNFEVNRITGDNIYNRTIYGVDLAFGSISEAELQNGAVGLTKLAAGTATGQLMQWDGNNWVLIPETDITVTEIDGVVGNEILDAADGTLVRSGAGDAGDPFVLDVAPLGIGNAELADDAVTTDKILDGTIDTADLDDDIITNNKMATNAIGTLELIDDSVDRDKIDADVAGIGLIQAADGSLEVDVASLTGDGDITSTDLNVTGGTDATFTDVNLEIAAGAVGNTEIAADAVTTDKIASGAVQSTDIAADAVNAATINNDVAGSGLTQNAGTGALEVDVTALTGDGDITSTDLTVTGGTDAAFNDVTLEIAADAVNAATINSDVAGSGLVQNASGALDVDVDNSTLEVDATNGLQIRDAGITFDKFTNGTTDNNIIRWNQASTQWEETSIATGLGQDVISTDGSISGVQNNAALVGMDLEVNVDGTTLEVDAVNGVQIIDDGVSAAKINNDVAGSGLVQNASGALDVDVDNSTLEVDATNGLQIRDAGITFDKFTNGTTDNNIIRWNQASTQWEETSIATGLGQDVISTDGSISGVQNNATLVGMDLEVNVDGTTLEVDAVNGVQIIDDGVSAAKINNDVAGSGLVQNASGALDVDVDNSTLEVDATNGLQIIPSANGGDVLTTVGGGVIWQAPAVVAMGKVDASLTPANTNLNGASVTNPSTGNYTVTFDVARPDANYIIQLTLLGAGTGSTIQVATQTNAGFTITISEPQITAPPISATFTTNVAGASDPHSHTGTTDPFPISDISYIAANASWYFTITDF